jgi:hypothetical protein
VKLISVHSDLTNEKTRLYYPSNHDTGADCKERHKHVVANIVEDIENLSHSTVRKGIFKIEYVVAKTNDD